MDVCTSVLIGMWSAIAKMRPVDYVMLAEQEGVDSRANTTGSANRVCGRVISEAFGVSALGCQE